MPSSPATSSWKGLPFTPSSAIVLSLAGRVAAWSGSAALPDSIAEASARSIVGSTLTTPVPQRAGGPSTVNHV